MNHLIDFMVIHQGIINSHDAMSSQEIIISSPGTDIMTISKTLEEVMEDVGTGGDDHIGQFHLNHIPDHLAHPARNHRSGQSQKDNAGRITKHLSIDIKALKDIPTLKRGILKSLDQT